MTSRPVDLFRHRPGGARAAPLDPSFPVVVHWLEHHTRYRQAALASPDLADPRTPCQNSPARLNVVLIHGGLSNCLVDFGDHLIGGPRPLLIGHPGIRVYRYEHDTWLPLERNIDELVQLVQRKLWGDALVFIAFSRGGVVATRVAAHLYELGAVHQTLAIIPGTHRDIGIMTFGSPHRGFATADVVAHMPRFGYCLQFLLSTSTDCLPSALRNAIFFHSLRRLRTLPPGIANLSPANPDFDRFIHSPIGKWAEARLHAFGGAPGDVDHPPRWWRILRVRPIPGVGDGAVALRSATAFGARRKMVTDCGHNDYFGRFEVRSAILSRLWNPNAAHSKLAKLA